MNRETSPIILQCPTSNNNNNNIIIIIIIINIRRLAVKRVNRVVIGRTSEDLMPLQVRAGVSGGAEAIVPAMRRSLDEGSDELVTVKLEFVNAFNSIRRDSLLDSIASDTPELCICIYSC